MRATPTGNGNARREEGRNGRTDVVSCDLEVCLASIGYAYLV